MKRFRILFFLIVIIGLTNCKDSDRDEDTTINSSTDYVTGQSILIDLFKDIHLVARTSQRISSTSLPSPALIPNCYTITTDTLSTPMSITIQFDPNCESDGAKKSGEITATFSNLYDVAGSKITIHFNNYTYNEFSIPSDSLCYTFNGLINAVPNYSFNVTNLKIEDDRFRAINWSASQTLSFVSGETTADLIDDTYLISGNANGKTFEGNDFSATITTNLRAIGACNWISSGEVTVSPENKSIRLLDFGSICDNEAIVSVFGIRYEIIIS